MSFDELLLWLYKAGTGWLGWTPDTTRSAHMQEIILAYEGKIDQLKAVHGSSDDKNGKPKKANNVMSANYDNLNTFFKAK